jgi:hypothetical protein
MAAMTSRERDAAQRAGGVRWAGPHLEHGPPDSREPSSAQQGRLDQENSLRPLFHGLSPLPPPRPGSLSAKACLGEGPILEPEFTNV